MKYEYYNFINLSYEYFTIVNFYYNIIVESKCKNSKYYLISSKAQTQQATAATLQATFNVAHVGSKTQIYI